MELAAERAKRWWQTRPPVRTIQRAAAFVDDVGLALLFPARGVELPSLYNAASERLADNLWTVEWGPEAERVWQWKDELPLGGRAWYGKFLGGRASLLSPALLADLYPRSGRPDDFTKAPLGEDARRIAEVVLLSGPTSTAALREELGLDGKKGQARFSRALAELGRHLVVTNFGVEDHGPGWPAAASHAIPVSSRGSAAQSWRTPRPARQYPRSRQLPAIACASVSCSQRAAPSACACLPAEGPSCCCAWAA